MHTIEDTINGVRERSIARGGRRHAKQGDNANRIACFGTEVARESESLTTATRKNQRPDVA